MLPAGFRERMRALLGDEARLLEESMAQEPVVGLRVNTLKVAPERLVERLPWRLAERVPWCPEGFVPEPNARPGLHPFHAAGLYYLQEPSAMAVVAALDPRPGELVIDLAAAPGGKSTQVAARLQGSGFLVANDVDGQRARELSRNLERWGARNVAITSEPVTTLAEAWPGLFDAVILDAPCSGEGMFRKSPEALKQWSVDLVRSCSAVQRQLLPAAARLVRPGGRLAYSTCTLAPEENEQVIVDFLAAAGREWEVVPLELPGTAGGRPDWAPEDGERYGLRGTVRLWPHRVNGEGHFVALLRRSGGRPAGPGAGSPGSIPASGPGGVAPMRVRSSGPGGAAPMRARAGGPEFEARPGRRRPARARRDRRGSAPGRAAGPGAAEGGRLVDAWRRFVAESLTLDPVPDWLLLAREDGLYALSPAAPDLTARRLLRPGLWLGRDGPAGFEPAHTLALALRADEARRGAELPVASSELARYLEGHELDVPGEDGWVLFTVAGFPLGWGRRKGGVVRNRYPRGLRRS